MECFFPAVAAAQAIADERRSQSGVSPIAVQTSINIRTATKPGIIIGPCSSWSIGLTGRVTGEDRNTKLPLGKFDAICLGAYVRA